jgi:hypothetical protein
MNANAAYESHSRRRKRIHLRPVLRLAMLASNAGFGNAIARMTMVHARVDDKQNGRIQ